MPFSRLPVDKALCQSTYVSTKQDQGFIVHPIALHNMQVFLQYEYIGRN